jgi:very-short-patch-repair endonuclease
MTTITDLVHDAGGLLHKRDLVAQGASDRHLTAAVRGGGVRWPRRGWYSTWPSSDPRFVAVAVGGRVAGAAALALRGAWLWRAPSLVVSVPRTASRIRRRDGVRVVWDGPEVSSRGAAAVVHVHDALARAVVEAGSFEDAVALADWSRRAGIVDMVDAEPVLGARRRDAAGLAAWSDGGAQSLIESVAGTRLRLRGRRIARQVVVGPLGEAVDMTVDGVAGLETDGREHHEGRFERDRWKDGLIARAGYLPFRASYRAVRDRWAETEAAVDAMLRTAGGPAPGRRLEPGLPRPLAARGSRSWRLGRVRRAARDRSSRRRPDRGSSDHGARTAAARTAAARTAAARTAAAGTAADVAAGTSPGNAPVPRRLGP